jgi:putative endonuclease
VKNRKLGDAAETLACRFLEKNGLTLVERNYRCKTGELDLIMQAGNELIFIEVRMRSNPNFGSAAESVDCHKQQRLIRAAQHYLQHRGQHDRPCRFDIIAIDGNREIQWLKNAFGL